MANQQDVDKALLSQITEMRGELLALKVFAAAIPGANKTPLQAIRNAFPKPGNPEYSADIIAAAHRSLDDLDSLRQLSESGRES